MDLALTVSPTPLTIDAAADTDPAIVHAHALTAHPVVLKVADAVLMSDRSPSTLQRLSLSPLVVDRMRRLVQMIGQLQSPESGWPNEQPKTAEAIAPYVMEEVEDVIAAWHDSATDTSPSSGRLATSTEISWADVFLLDTLESWLVWTAARSAYETMRLLEGVVADVAPPGATWIRGIIRLSMVLELQTPNYRWAIDLVTRQAPPNLLPLDATIRTADYELCHQPMDASRLLQTITTQIRMTTPDAGLFLNGVTVDSLIPHYLWQTGLLQVRLGLQFIPDAVDPVSYDAIAPERHLSSDREELHSTAQVLAVAITDAPWKEQYEQIVTNQQMELLLHRTSLHTGASAETSTDDLAHHLIADANALVEPLKTLLTLTGRLFPLSPLSIEDLITRLLWCFNRSDRKTMQLMGGIPARRLQPGCLWETGVLRLQTKLNLQTPEMGWCIDLATGQVADPVWSLHPQAIVQPSAVGWEPQPMRLEDLRRQVLRQLDEMTPELRLLLNGTTIDLFDSDRSSQPGTLQLAIEFDFSPITRH